YLDGEVGSDVYFVNVTQSGTATITVNDTGGSDADQLTVFGTDGDDTFWFQKEPGAAGRGFIDYFSQGSGFVHGFTPLIVEDLVTRMDDVGVTDDLTRPLVQAVDASQASHFQRIYYQRVDTVEVRGGDGKDLF